MAREFKFNEIVLDLNWFAHTFKRSPSLQYEEGGDADPELVGRTFVFEVGTNIDGDGKPVTGILIYEMQDVDVFTHLVSVFRQNELDDTHPALMVCEPNVEIPKGLTTTIVLDIQDSIVKFREEMDQPKQVH